MTTVADGTRRREEADDDNVTSIAGDATMTGTTIARPAAAVPMTWPVTSFAAAW